MTASVGLLFDWTGGGFGAGANDDCTALLMSYQGQRGGSPELTGSAQAGSATFVLLNPDGLFDPDNASSPLYGLLRDGVRVWFGANEDGSISGAGTPRGRFAGRVTDISPLPMAGAGTSTPTVEIVCEDALGWFARTQVALSVPAVAADYVPPLPGYWPPDCTASGSSIPKTTQQTFWPLGTASAPGGAELVYYGPGGSGASTYVTGSPGLDWYFPVYGAGGSGTHDDHPSGLNETRLRVVGPGTAVFDIRDEGGASGAVFDIVYGHVDDAGTVVTTDGTLTSLPLGSVSVTIPAVAGFCRYWAKVRSTGGTSYNVGLYGVTWTPDGWV